jgi:hypothetical protein
MTKAKSKLLVVLSMFLALLLTIASLGTFNAKADDTKKTVEIDGTTYVLTEISDLSSFNAVNCLIVVDYTNVSGMTGSTSGYKMMAKDREIGYFYNNGGFAEIEGWALCVPPVSDGFYITSDGVSYDQGIIDDNMRYFIINSTLDNELECSFVQTNGAEVTAKLYYATEEVELKPEVKEETLKDKWNEFTSDIADLFNENTGMAVSSSVVSIVIVGAIIYIVFGPRRRR